MPSLAQETSVVLPEPTYGLYAQVFAAAGASIEYVPCPELRLDLDEMAASAARVGARLVVVCDPNNPTGSLAEQDEWDSFLDAVPEGCAVVVDEAYCEYVDPDAPDPREKTTWPRGGRLFSSGPSPRSSASRDCGSGYAVVSEPLASYLDVVQEPFNVNRAALAAGTASLRSPEIVEERRLQAAESRELLTRLLEAADIEVHAVTGELRARPGRRRRRRAHGRPGVPWLSDPRRQRVRHGGRRPHHGGAHCR